MTASSRGCAIDFQHVVRPTLFNQTADAREVEDALGYFNTVAGVLDVHLEGRSTIVGDDWTVADFAIGNPLAYADAMGLPVQPFPNVVRWYAGLSALDAWRSPFPA